MDKIDKLLGRLEECNRIIRRHERKGDEREETGQENTVDLLATMVDVYIAFVVGDNGNMEIAKSLGLVREAAKDIEEGPMATFAKAFIHYHTYLLLDCIGNETSSVSTSQSSHTVPSSSSQSSSRRKSTMALRSTTLSTVSPSIPPERHQPRRMAKTNAPNYAIDRSPSKSPAKKRSSTVGEEMDKGMVRKRKRRSSSTDSVVFIVEKKSHPDPTTGKTTERRTEDEEEAYGTPPSTKQSSRRRSQRDEEEEGKEMEKALISLRVKRIKRAFRKASSMVDPPENHGIGPVDESWSSDELWSCGSQSCSERFTSSAKLYYHMLQEHSLEGVLVAKCLECEEVGTFPNMIVHRKHAGESGCGGEKATLVYWYVVDKMKRDEDMNEVEKIEKIVKDSAENLSRILRTCLLKGCEDDKVYSSFMGLQEHTELVHNIRLQYVCESKKCRRTFYHPLEFIRHQDPNCHLAPNIKGRILDMRRAEEEKRKRQDELYVVKEVKEEKEN